MATESWHAAQLPALDRVALPPHVSALQDHRGAARGILPLTADRVPPRPLLLIEGDPDPGPLIAEMLEEEDAVTLVSGGADGFEAAQRGECDATVLDRRLPSSDGMQIISRLRPPVVPTEVLMLTAAPLREHEHREPALLIGEPVDTDVHHNQKKSDRDIATTVHVHGYRTGCP